MFAEVACCLPSSVLYLSFLFPSWFFALCFIFFIDHEHMVQHQELIQHMHRSSISEDRKMQILAALNSHEVTFSDVHRSTNEEVSRRFACKKSQEGGSSTTRIPYNTCNDRIKDAEMTSSAVSPAPKPMTAMDVKRVALDHDYGSLASTSSSADRLIGWLIGFVNQGIPDRNTCKNIERIQVAHNSTTCAICMDEYKVGDVVCWSKHPSCSHAFHQNCILPWLMYHDTCPYCRCSYFATKDA